MATTIEYASYIIDLTDAMLNHRRGLNLQQIDHLETINRRTVDFVTSFLLHEKADLDSLFSYLNHDVMQPIAVIIGYSEFMLMGGAGGMMPAYRDAVEEIRDCGYNLQYDVQAMLEELIEFMESIGYERVTRAQQIQPVQPPPQAAKTIQPLAPKQPIKECDDSTQPSRPNAVQSAQSKPIRRLEPLR